MNNGVIPGSPEDLRLKTKQALKSGCALMDLMLKCEESGDLRTFPLASPDECLVEMSGFYVEDPRGFRAPVMGCLQRAVFQREWALSPDDLQALPRSFSRLCEFAERDGSRRGFSYLPLLACEAGDKSPRPVEPGRGADFSLEGLDWLLLRVDIHDFVRAAVPFPALRTPLARFFRESALVVVHRDYSRVGGPSPAEPRRRQSFGYSFLPVAPEPNIFGFGPGHFGTAVKRFVFTLMPGDRMEVELLFVVSPRSEKVLNLAGFDPVYGAVEALDALTFRKLGVRNRLHDRFDAMMLRMHGQVHHNLLLDMREVWEKGSWAL